MVSGNREMKEPETFVLEFKDKGTEDQESFPKFPMQGHYSLSSSYCLLFENYTGINLLVWCNNN